MCFQVWGHTLIFIPSHMSNFREKYLNLLSVVIGAFPHRIYRTRGSISSFSVCVVLDSLVWCSLSAFCIHYIPSMNTWCFLNRVRAVYYITNYMLLFAAAFNPTYIQAFTLISSSTRPYFMEEASSISVFQIRHSQQQWICSLEEIKLRKSEGRNYRSSFVCKYVRK